MDSSINLSILLPLLPFGMTLFIFVLLISFNRTINRLTMPISYLSISSLLGTSLLGIFYLINNVQADISLTYYLPILSKMNLVLHLNAMSEKIIILI